MDVNNIQFSLLSKTCKISIYKLRPASFINIFHYGNAIFCIAISTEKLEAGETIDSTKNIRIIYQERAYASNEIPNSKNKRETSNEADILIARTIDRAIRSVLPYINIKIELNITLINNSKEDDISAGAILGSSIAIKLFLGNITTICFPISTIINNEGALSVNSYYDYNNKRVSRILYTFTINNKGETYINMAEVTARPSITTESLVQIIDLLTNKAKIEADNITTVVNNYLKGHPIEQAKDINIKTINYHVNNKIINEAINELSNDFAKSEKCPSEIYKRCFKELEKRHNFTYESINITKLIIELAIKEALQELYVSHNLRIDGRKFNQQRKITYQTDILPNAHNSIMISRGNGDTTLLCTMTINQDSKRLLEIKRRPIIAHYNLNSFAVKEQTKTFHAKRRDWGHGNIIESSLYSIVDFKNILTNEIRIVVDVISADGATSITGAIASSIMISSIKKSNNRALSGASIGGIRSKDNKDEILLLMDLNAIEDTCGLFDMKIITDQKNIVFIQLDSKEQVINIKLLKKILSIANKEIEDDHISKENVDRPNKLHYLLDKHITIETTNNLESSYHIKKELKRITTELGYKVKIVINKNNIEIYATNNSDLIFTRNKINRSIELLMRTQTKRS